ncbi:hypothetical protein [Flagellimonas sp.]|uniref:hypothetical protein n=1 Tax=Flagellimonas sp. TaxID=2058762 RepID=UPI003B592366
MKRLIFILFLVPCVLLAQENQQVPMFMNVMLTAHPAKISEFEAGLAAHNKKYHAEGAASVSVFWVASGKNSGKYIWSNGPTTWAAMDEVNNPDPAHSADWNTNVAPYAMAEMETTFWKNDPTHSNFTKDFKLKNLSIFMLDIKRFKQQQFMAALDKVYEVFKAKDSDRQWGVYFNELNNMDGQDMVWVDFFDKSAWMGREDKFPQWFEEVHGAGTFMAFLTDFENSTNGDNQELWIFREDLSGSSGDVQARQ